MLKTVFRFFAVFVVQNFCSAQVNTFNTIPANSPTNLGSVSSASSFRNAFSSADSTSGAIAQPTSRIPAGNNFCPSAVSASASAASFQSSILPSSLQTFISAFTNAVDSSPELTDMFDLSQTTPQAFADYIYGYIHSHSTSVGCSDPHNIATSTIQPLKKSFKVVTNPMLVRINANWMGKVLLAEGILNDMNAASLALAFANEMETSAKRTVDKSFQESKFKALGNGFVAFMKSQGLYTQEKVPVVARYYRNELRLVGSQFR